MRMDAELATRIGESYPPGEKYLIGVSGGRDSMALWHFLRGAGYRNLVVCHLNHQLRGAESDGDAELVRKTAAAWECEAEIGVANVGKLAANRKLSIEAAARQARHEFFAEVAANHDCPRIFLAHHADDQVETALINLCRGSGLRGFGGMPSEGTITVGEAELKLIRPLLETWRDEVDGYIGRHAIAFREDATNQETVGSARNRIRHELIPLMGNIFDRDVRGAIRRLSAMAADEDEMIEAMAEERWPGLSDPKKKGLDAGRLRALQPAMQRHVIYRWLRGEAGISACRYQDIEAVRRILSPVAEIAKVNLPGGWHARRRQGRVFLQAPPK